MPAGGFVSMRKRSATNNLKLAESAKKAKVGAATELESQILLLSTQNAALIAENALQKSEIAAQKTEIAAHKAESTGLRAKVEAYTEAFDWTHRPTTSIYKTNKETRNKMGKRLEKMVQFIDTQTGIFFGSTSFTLELLSADDSDIVKIPFSRDPACNDALVRGNIKVRDCKQFCDNSGTVYNEHDWKLRTTRRALALKDECLMSDNQYHEFRLFSNEILKGQGSSANPMPTLTAVKKLRKSLDEETKTNLHLKPVMGAPVISEPGALCDDCTDIATCYCTHTKCEDSKNMCQKHFAIHTERKSTKSHVVYSIDVPRRYNRPLNMIGAQFDLKSVISEGLTIFWKKLSDRVQNGLPIFLRFTLDGAMLTHSKNFCSSSLKWILAGINPDMSEMLISTVHCPETLEEVTLNFKPLLQEVELLNKTGLFYTPTGALEPLLVKLKILIGPDGKMLNVCYGGNSHMSDCFCIQCKITANLLKSDPWKFWAKGDPQVPHLKDPMCRDAENACNCTLHCRLRLYESILGNTLELCNSGQGGPKESHALHIIDVCKIPGFVFFGENTAPCSGQKTASTHSSLTGGKWVKFLHYFDLTRVYSGNNLILSQILFSLFAVITFALERKIGSIGYLSGRQIRVLCLVLLDVYNSLYGIMPAARYVHYVMTHMVELKDSLAEQGYDLGDFSTSTSELLQKKLRQQFSRASNFHPDAPMQVASRSARMRRTASVEIDEKEATRLKQAEVRRHQKLFKTHKCTRVYMDWLPGRISGMVSNGTISADDIKDIDISELSLCPFCCILGESTISKVSEKRKRSEAEKTAAEHPCDSDESDFDYDPLYASGASSPAGSNASSNDSLHSGSDYSGACYGNSDNED